MTATKTQTLSRPTFGDRLIRFIFWYRRLHRLWFPSSAEIAFIRLMRGHVLMLPIKSRRGSNLCIVRRGRLLKGELLEREVWVGGKYCVDFGTPRARYQKAIEVDGTAYHQDVLREQQRDEFLRAHGWEVLHVPARRIQREPLRVRRDVLQFLKS